jgi:hypothetical protein
MLCGKQLKIMRQFIHYTEVSCIAKDFLYNKKCNYTTINYKNIQYHTAKKKKKKKIE